MVKSRPSHSEQLPENSSSSDTETEDSSSELIRRPVSFTTWSRLPPARVVPTDSSARRWVTDRNPSLRPFRPAPASGDDFFKDSLVSKVVRREEALLFHNVPNTRTHLVGPSLLRSRVGIADAIKLSPRLGVFRKVDDLEYLVQRWSHTTHTFYTAWGEFTPTLEDVYVLLKLPMFGDCDISNISVESHLIDMAKDLKAATIESGRYSREFLAKRRAAPIPPSDPSGKTPPKKVRGTGNVLPPEQRKSARESLKCTFSTWVRYFFDDYDAEGTRLPLAPLFLGGLYGRLDQIQDQMFSSFEYAPVRTVPEPVPDGTVRLLEPRVWGWTMGCPRQLLSEILDEEDQFVHRPYTINLFPGFLITDNVSAAGGAFWPYSYRPDRICRQFGLDQAPQNIDLEFHDVAESMRAVLFKPADALPEFDASKYIPSDRAGRVLDLWVAYFARLKTSVKRYEGQDSLQVFPDIQIMYKDPYFVTTSACSIEKSGAQSKKRKAARSKGSKGKSASGTVVKKARRELESTPPATVGTRSPSKKGTQNRSPKLKKEPAVGTRASERLKAKPSTKVEDQSPSPPPASHAATQGSSIEKGVDGDEADSPGLDHDSTPSCGSIPADAIVEEIVPDSISKGAMDSPIETSSPKMLTQSNAVTFAAPVPMQVLSVEPVPILASLLPDDDARVLSEFSARHAGFLLPEDVFPRAFLKPAYTLFADFLRFVRSHSAMELLSSHKNKVVEDLKALSLFGFKGDWFDDLSCRFDRHVPFATLEDLTKITDAALSLELRNNDLRTEIDRLKLELS
ncbi:Aminotransferase-like, plant mobile domain [Sesbania bispinosa]|nr:Aminotransferase-like, plant mobile domain [Sesbania bispinosa]